ncbi:MAG TPA: GDSL-type esterase/lipase family protein [Steroidobacteraceae bacterium]|nr:GDSL-type esterase/lipase family protein [Steroidobacteraceae bacterium]
MKIRSSLVNRRSVIAGSIGAGLTLPLAMPALGEEVCVKKPGTPPALEPERLLTDWAWLARYRDENAQIIASKTKVTAVFLGDSITEGWREKQPDFFAKGNVCRGISAQTTPQMLVRMRADVVDLFPRVVHIMAGTNDIAFNTGPMSADDTKRNIMALSDIARANKIRVVLASIPPAAFFPWRQGLETASTIIALNGWISGYAKATGAVYADYHSAMSNGKGGMKPGLATDEVHPSEEGYAVMRPVAEQAIAAAIK